MFVLVYAVFLHLLLARLLFTSELLCYFHLFSVLKEERERERAKGREKKIEKPTKPFTPTNQRTVRKNIMYTEIKLNAHVQIVNLCAMRCLYVSDSFCPSV